MVFYPRLEKIFRRMSRLSHLASIAIWDRAVMMPEGGSEARAAAMAELQVLLVEIMNSPETGDLMARAEGEVSQLSLWQQANLREMKRAWLLETAVEADLVEAKSIASARCEQAWRQLRAENNWRDFLPLFEEVVNLSRKEAEQRSAATGLPLFDSLLDLYEPGLSTDQVDTLFNRLKSFLPDFIQEVVERQKTQDYVTPKGPFPVEKQRELALEIMKVVGFDFNHGRLDVSHHPFCGGVPQDVRLTTRYQTDAYQESLMGVLHETGHASYEQNRPAEWLDQPVSSARSMGLHESQSLLFEMQVGRGRPFLTFAAPIMKKYLAQPGDDLEAWSPENIFRSLTRVKPGYIRVNADEVTYPAHIILRYEIERDLIQGGLEARDVPDVWDEKMKSYLGLSTAGNYKDGPMQDIHWPSGAFGYFPTYTLGAINAAQIFAAIRREVPVLDDLLAQGDLKPLRGWLREKIWSQGSFLPTSQLMVFATEEEMNPKYFIEHLQNRYLGD